MKAVAVSIAALLALSAGGCGDDEQIVGDVGNGGSGAGSGTAGSEGAPGDGGAANGGAGETSGSDGGSGTGAAGGDENPPPISDASSGDGDLSATDAGDAARADARTQTDAGSSDDLILITEPLFFSLPINSLRYAVSGYDDKNDLCITAVWFLTDLGDQTQHCDDFGVDFPYLVITPGEPSGCWKYGANADIVSITGCVDFADFGPDHADQVDLELVVDSAVWSGTVRFDNTR
jgi:hypothetical protein